MRGGFRVLGAGGGWHRGLKSRRDACAPRARANTSTLEFYDDLQKTLRIHVDGQRDAAGQFHRV
jgi:hypothetical protein